MIKIDSADTDCNAMYMLNCNAAKIPTDLPHGVAMTYLYANHEFDETYTGIFRTEKEAINALILIAEHTYPGEHFSSADDITAFLRKIGQNGNDVMLFNIIKILN